MPASRSYLAQEPAREELDALPGTVLVEFGAPWCPHCIAAETPVAEVLSGRGEVSHLRIEDGRGRRLGRSFGVKLWPTLVLMREGVELARSVRPRSTAEVEVLFENGPA